jgi:hypothetical protein
MIPRLDAKRLKTILNALYGAESRSAATPITWIREQVGSVRGYLENGRKQT